MKVEDIESRLEEISNRPAIDVCRMERELLRDVLIAVSVGDHEMGNARRLARIAAAGIECVPLDADYTFEIDHQE